MNNPRDSNDVEWFLKELSKMNNINGQNNTDTTQPEYNNTPNNLTSGNNSWDDWQVERLNDRSGSQCLLPGDWKGIDGEATENHTLCFDDIDVTAPPPAFEAFPWTDRGKIHSSNNGSNPESLKQELKRKDQEIQQVNAKLTIVEESIKDMSRWIEAHRSITMPLNYPTSTSWPNQGRVGGVQVSDLDAIKQQQEQRDGELHEVKEKIRAIEDYVNQATQWMKKLHETVSHWVVSP